jgi:hypothetical protein
VARLATLSQGVCQIAGPLTEDRGPPAVPEASRLLVLPVTACRWVLTDNKRLVYFISEVLYESKVFYPTIQKLHYGILITSRKLHHYFDAYNILVVTDFSLANILQNRDNTGHISKWAVELGALTLDIKPRTAIKSQAPVDFMVEWRENQVEAATNQPEHWVM